MIEAKARMPKMHEASLSSLIVPYGADQTLYVVVDRVSGAKEIRIERTDLESTIGELIAGCFSDPVRVMSFNTLEHWTKDISTEIATEIQARCDIEAMATYLLFQRDRLVQGTLGTADYRDAVARARGWVGQQAAPHWRDFLAAWPPTEG